MSSFSPCIIKKSSDLGGSQQKLQCNGSGAWSRNNKTINCKPTEKRNEKQQWHISKSENTQLDFTVHIWMRHSRLIKSDGCQLLWRKKPPQSAAITLNVVRRLQDEKAKITQHSSYSLIHSQQRKCHILKWYQNKLPSLAFMFVSYSTLALFLLLLPWNRCPWNASADDTMPKFTQQSKSFNFGP